jgi:Polyketide cyclase / dehydrase and lipid transport
MKISLAVRSLAFAVGIVGAASAGEVTSKIAVNASADQAWAAIGQFCDIQSWLPDIATCEIGTRGDATIRTLTTKRGEKIIEQQQSRDDKGRSYTYTILEGPPPVANYRSTISVQGAGTAVEIAWTGSFDPKGATEDEAKKVIGGIYSAGLDGLKSKLEGK